MTDIPLTSIATRTGSLGKVSTLTGMNTRQSIHGGSPWSTPSAGKDLLQPQDGNTKKRMGLAIASSHLHTNLLNEPEDARMTGGTRSLTRRLMGLNVTMKRRVTSETITAITRTGVA
jgi:hypothetical protein